jgi:hypothetical protein
MKLKIPHSKAIEILQKRIRELSNSDFQPKVWKDKTHNDLKEIFVTGDTKWLQVSGLNFSTFIESEKNQVMQEGKTQARQLLESYIEQIDEYLKIQVEREVIEEDNYRKKYSDLLEEWNGLVPSYNILLKEKEALQEVIEGKDAQVSNRDDEIERLNINTVQLSNISLLKLFKLVFGLPIGQVITFFVVIIGIISGSFKLGEIYSSNQSENEKYDLRKSNDDLIELNSDLQDSLNIYKMKIDKKDEQIEDFLKTKITTPNKK